MKIVFNMVHLSDVNTATGIGYHQLNIVEGLMALSLQEHYIFIVNDIVKEQLTKKYPKIITISYGKQDKIPKIFKKYYYYLNVLFIDQIYIKKIVNKIKPDVIFQPFNSITIKTRWKIPVVIMVLDMYHRFFSEQLGKAKYYITVKRHDSMMKYSDAIITSTNVNKKHISRFYPKSSKKINVIPVPISIDTTKIKKFSVKTPYILCVNSLRYHKNIHTLIKAFDLIKEKIKHDLILIGTSENDEANNIKNKNSRIHFTGYISEAERNYLYKMADLNISPTMFEGFGMTPLEAMLFEKKVLVSDIEVMRESTFNRAQYFMDIENEDILAKKIIEVLSIKEDNSDLKDCKEEVIKRYNPRVVAKQIHQVLMKTGGEKQ
ncbi:MAG: glycosyltransferase family 4 protein [Clostridiales bacterium]|nr:glycosyltransferase family 4 protein [Clostridiales bacterium]